MREIALHMADIAENSLAAGAARIRLSVMIDRAADRLTTAVEDNGRGIPVGIHEKLGVSGVEVVYTQLHAGGKFDNDAYGFSGGLHGVGASVVNALSEYVIVEVATEGKSYIQRFHSYTDAEGNTHSGIPEGPLQETGRTRKRGTRVTFLPDRRVFETLDMNFEIISKRLRELAYLNRGVRFTLTDERTRGDKKEREYCFEGGLSDFVKYLNADKTPLYPEPIHISGTKDGIVVELAMQHNDGYTESMFSYVNIPTTEGGTHETGFKSALTKIMNDYCRKSGLLKEKDASLSGEDFREGLTVVLALKMHSVQFEGQTKTRLGNTEAKPAVEFVMNEFLTPFLEDLKNSETASLMADKAIKAAKVRESARKAKSMAREKNKLDNAPLVGKLSSCTGRDYKINELFIVEGDSAGGSAKQGRDRRFQAILPLRGKPLNVEKKRIDQVLQNEEFRSIITAIGTGIGEDFDISGLVFAFESRPDVGQDFQHNDGAYHHQSCRNQIHFAPAQYVAYVSANHTRGQYTCQQSRNDHTYVAAFILGTRELGSYRDENLRYHRTDARQQRGSPNDVDVGSPCNGQQREYQ